MTTLLHRPSKIKYDYTTTPPTRMVDCIECGKERKYHAKDLCELCYSNIRSKNIKKRGNLIF